MSLDPHAADTSVTFSLAELTQLENQRLREEEGERARQREQAARERREAETRRNDAEAQRLAAEAEARAKRAREEALDRARAGAREQAAVEVARIEAEARTRLDADNAVRAHELAVLRVRTESGRRTTLIALAAALGLSLCAGIGVAVRSAGQIATLEQRAEALRDGQAALARDRDAVKAAELGALDRRFAALAAHPLAGSVAADRRRAEAARAGVDAKSPDASRLRAFGDALDALGSRLEAAERLAALDHRRADLVAWSAERTRSDASTTDADAAAARAATALSDDSLHAYEHALDELHLALAHKTSSGGTRGHKEERKSGTVCTDPHDPMCGLDGRSL